MQTYVVNSSSSQLENYHTFIHQNPQLPQHDFSIFHPNYPYYVGSLLEQILILTARKQSNAINSSKHGTNDCENQLQADVLPKISIKDYVLRLHTYTQLSQSCMISTLIYIDRVMQKYPNMNLQFSNIHRLVLSCFIVAAKYLQDELQTQQHLSRVAGVSVDELFKLQIIVMDMLEWNAYISPKQYLTYKQKLDILAHQSFTKKQQVQNNVENANTIQITNEYIIKDSKIVYKFSSPDDDDDNDDKLKQNNSLGLEKSFQKTKSVSIGDKNTHASSSSSNQSSPSVNNYQIKRNNSLPNNNIFVKSLSASNDDEEEDKQEVKHQQGQSNGTQALRDKEQFYP